MNTRRVKKQECNKSPGCIYPGLIFFTPWGGSLTAAPTKGWKRNINPVTLITQAVQGIVYFGGNDMKGVQFVVDEHGTKTAVVINLKRYSELWEDFYDSALAQARKKEPRESLASVKKRLMIRGKNRSHG